MVSVIIPIFNSELYLDKCIEGVINQYYEDFEILIIDDGSKDNSWAICQKWASLDSRIRLFKQSNKGASAARNLGLDNAKGNWILFIDSDDIVLPTYISNLINAIGKKKSITLAISGLQVYRNNSPAERIGFPNLLCENGDYQRIFGDIKLHKYGFSVGKLYNRKIVEDQHLRFDEKICIGEDCNFMLNYLICCLKQNKSEVSFLDTFDYLYYIHTNSLSTKTSSIESELYSYNQYKKAINKVKECMGVNDSTFEFLNKTKTTGLGRSVDHILLTRNDNGKWTAHLIEMKSGVSIKRWNEIKLKARASMLNIKALAAVLDISLESIVVYTTYEKLVLEVGDPTNLAGRKPMLGGGWKENEWDKNRIAIRIPKGREEYLTHKGIKMTKARIDAFDVLCGELSLA